MHPNHEGFRGYFCHIIVAGGVAGRPILGPIPIAGWAEPGKVTCNAVFKRLKGSGEPAMSVQFRMGWQHLGAAFEARCLQRCSIAWAETIECLEERLCSGIEGLEALAPFLPGRHVLPLCIPPAVGSGTDRPTCCARVTAKGLEGNAFAVAVLSDARVLDGVIRLQQIQRGWLELLDAFGERSQLTLLG